jgi:hypothetical protein
MKRWSAAQLEALLELEGDGTQRLLSPAETAQLQGDDLPVKKGCICPNSHKPNSDGLIFTSPACQLHGCHTRFVQRSRLTEYDLRTPGIIHGRKAS